MSRYSDRYRTPSPLFPQQSPTTLAKLLNSWEILRELDIHGYRSSSAAPCSTWLVKIAWADGHSSGRSTGRGTTCSPFTTQAAAIAYSSTDSEPYRPLLVDGRALPNLFSHAANGALRRDNRAHQKAMEAIGLTMADNEWPRPIVFFNMGFSVEPEQMRRGDAVHIDWMNGGGHAVYCWDVHLNDRGEVDAFTYVSSNGRLADGGSGGGVSVGGTGSGSGARGLIGSRTNTDGVKEFFAEKKPLFVDDERYVVEGAWITWDDNVAGKLLTDMRARPSTKVKKAKRVKAARFHGIDVSQIPLYAMGQDTPAPFTPRQSDERGPEINTPPIQTMDEIASLQRRLKLLYLIGWIRADTGKIDGKSGRKTTAALVNFQRQNGLPAGGKPDALTMTKLESVFRSAFDDPKAQKYLDPQRPGGLTFGDGDLSDNADLYFRHGVVRTGEDIELILIGKNLPQNSLDVEFYDASSEEKISIKDCVISPIGDRGTVTLTLPVRTAGRRLMARIKNSELQSGAPLRVLAAGNSPAT